VLLFGVPDVPDGEVGMPEPEPEPEPAPGDVVPVPGAPCVPSGFRFIVPGAPVPFIVPGVPVAFIVPGVPSYVPGVPVVVSSYVPVPVGVPGLRVGVDGPGRARAPFWS